MNENRMDEDAPAGFPLSERDLEILRALSVELRNLLCGKDARFIKAAACALLALERLPEPTPGVSVEYGYETPSETGNYGWATLTLREDEIEASIGEHFYDPAVGGDTESKRLFFAALNDDRAYGDLEYWIECARQIASCGSMVLSDESEPGAIDWEDEAESTDGADEAGPAQGESPRSEWSSDEELAQRKVDDELSPDEDTPWPANYGANNTLVTRERAEELIKPLKAKLHSQVAAGIDTKILATGTEPTVFHNEEGTTKSEAMAQNLEEKTERDTRRAQAYANLHKKYLEQNHPQTFRQLKESGELGAYLRRVGQTAQERYEAIEIQMATAKNLPKDYLERVAALEQIPFVADEIVMDEVVNNPTP